MAPAPPPGRIPRLCARLAPPVAQDDFRADVFFPGSTFSDGLRFVAEHIFGVKDWDGELQRLTSDSGFTHEQAANIPKHVFATGTRSEWLPGLTILRKAIVRRLATFVFPPALIVSIAGPSAWTLLSGAAAGVVVGVPLACLWSFSVVLAIVLTLFTTAYLTLVSGAARRCALWVSAQASAARTRPELLERFRNAVRPAGREARVTAQWGSAMAGAGVHGSGDEYGFDCAVGESIEVIWNRWESFTKYASLDIGEKYISPGAFAPWEAADEERLGPPHHPALLPAVPIGCRSHSVRVANRCDRGRARFRRRYLRLADLRGRVPAQVSAGGGRARAPCAPVQGGPQAASRGEAGAAGGKGRGVRFAHHTHTQSPSSR